MTSFKMAMKDHLVAKKKAAYALSFFENDDRYYFRNYDVTRRFFNIAIARNMGRVRIINKSGQIVLDSIFMTMV